MESKKVIKNVLIATMNGGNQTFTGAIGIENGKIKYVGPSERLPAEWKAATEIACPSKCLVLPSFFDGHTHVDFLLWRYWGKENKNKAESASCDEKIRIIQLLHNEAKAAGISFLNDFATYEPGQINRSEKGLGLIDVLEQFNESGIGGFVRVRLLKKSDGILNKDDSVRHIEEAVQLSDSYKFPGRPILLYIHLPVEREKEYSRDVLDSYKEVIDTIRNEKPEVYKKIWLHGHCCESKKNAEFAKQEIGQSSIASLKEYSLLNNRTVLAHCIHISEEDVDLIKQADARVLTVPKFTEGCLAPIGRMLDKDIKVGLCSDTYAVAPIRWAVQAYHAHRYYEGRTFSRELKPMEALEMATKRNAAVFNLEKEFGSIEIGKYADLVLIDLESKIFEPFWRKEFWKLEDNGGVYDNYDWNYAIGQMIRCGTLSSREIYTTMVNGEFIYHND